MEITIRCGICDAECDTRFNYQHEIIATCPDCKQTLREDEIQIGDLEDEIFELQKKLITETIDRR
jgi:hypothetical protein